MYIPPKRKYTFTTRRGHPKGGQQDKNSRESVKIYTRINV